MSVNRSDFEILSECSCLLARHGLLRSLLGKIICDEMINDVSLAVDQQEHALKNYKSKYGFRDEKELEQHRLNELLSLDDLKYRIERPEKLKHYCKEHFRARAEAHFLERKNALDQVTYRLLRVRDDGLARELYIQIIEGEASFPELASKHSQGRERNTSGLIGPLPINQSHPLLADRLRAATEGELIEPFQVDNWWLLVRVESLAPAIFDEAMANQMSLELFQQWLDDEVKQRLLPIEEALKGDAAVTMELSKA